MPGPAARTGDPTAHGGTIVGPGCPTVLIGGMPAARAGADMHTCPMVTPVPTPVPHVGGPIVGPGVPTVLIGGLPAVTIGDMATCVGPPSAIVMGCPTVLIGTGGGGGSAGGGGGAPAVAAAGALSAIAAEPGPEATGPHWFECRFVDSAGKPITEVRYEVTDPDNRTDKGVLTGDGTIRRGGLPAAGDYTVQLFAVYHARWSKQEARVGDLVDLSAETEGYADGSTARIEIWERDVNGADELADELQTAVEGGRISAQWKYRYREERDVSSAQQGPDSYSDPEHYFIVHVGDDRARSGQLKHRDTIEIELKDQDDTPIADETYILHLPNGEVRKGKLDANGYRKEENLPPGKYDIEFPEIKDE